MADAMKLLPCPFCGDRARVCRYGDPKNRGLEYDGTAVQCSGPACGAELRSTSSANRTDAVAAWNRRAAPPAREEAPAEGAGEISQLEMRAMQAANIQLPVADYQALVRDLWRAACDGSEITADALRNRTSEPEAGAVAWRGNGQYEPTKAMIDAGLETCRPGNHANMIASFKAMMQQAEIDGLVITHPAPATADKLREIDELIAACEAEFCSPGTEGGSFTYGEDDDSEVAYPKSNITFGHIRRARQALATLNEQPQ